MKIPLYKQAEELLKEQLEHWALAKSNYEALKYVQVRSFVFEHFEVKVQYNEKRILSSSAKVDTQSIQERPCFLCEKNRPKEQLGIEWKEDYVLLVNPYPIFFVHFTIPSLKHCNQRILGRMGDMLHLSKDLEGYVVFYNGPHCGASAPDHFHFQAGNIDFLPVIHEMMELKTTLLFDEQEGVQIYTTTEYLRKVITLKGVNIASLEKQFNRIYHLLDRSSNEEEPLLNVQTYYKENNWYIHVFPRQKHRPSCYFKKGEEQLLISPASVDMGGVLITPRKVDYEKITVNDVKLLFQEVTIHEAEWNVLLNKMKIPIIEVGILSSSSIAFVLDGINYKINSRNNLLFLEKNGVEVDRKLEFIFNPLSNDSVFLIKDVVIGVDFHWEQKEDQQFKGAFKFILENNKVTAINLVSIEDYLESVISSEMSAHSSMELLKAHAITSRSWLLAQLEKHRNIEDTTADYISEVNTNDEYIKWFDREDHAHFDVCADDHCQRYQGITRANTPQVETAVRETRGEVLCYNNKICDARFYKCCGGITELFENCWEPQPHAYLKNMVDFKPKGSLSLYKDISKEEEAKDWIFNHTQSFCNTKNIRIISQVLNEYDQQTPNFYRWKVTLTQEEITHLIPQRLGIDFGNILDLIPIERGPSGRLIKLKIVGTLKTLVIGKELLIRKALSKSHLYSSAFIVEKGTLHKGIPVSFTLVGAGWGHGVGLCQIGAAVMGAEGFTHHEILTHYFPSSEIKTNYGNL